MGQDGSSTSGHRFVCLSHYTAHSIKLFTLSCEMRDNMDTRLNKGKVRRGNLDAKVDAMLGKESIHL